VNTEVDVALAGESDRRLIDGLAQFHIYDFSEFDPAESDDFEPRADGRFEPIPHFDSYWREDSRLALLIRRGDRPVGFALIDAVTHGGPPVDRGMAEFFVLRKHRRAGVASAAVRAEVWMSSTRPITSAWECRSMMSSASQSIADKAPTSSGTPETRVVHRAPAKRSGPFSPSLPANRSATSS